jgi:hypothetical protein
MTVMTRPFGTARVSRPGARWLILLALLLVPLGACSSGQECDTCTTDDDCDAGRVCSKFSDGSQRCGSGTGDTECRVR